MNWKDLLAFNRSERNGIIVFIFILLIIIISPLVHKTYFLSETTVDPENFKKQILAFEEQLSRLKQESKMHDLADGVYEYDERVFTQPEISLQPFEFNPNNLSVELWLRMGMPERVVRTIKNFENAGGSFRYREDLTRIYGLNDDIYSRLEPYIELPSRHNITEDETEIAEKTFLPKTVKEIIIDINSADSLELIKIRGIGPVFSSRIIRYRELLGGFVSVTQLRDVYGIDEERFESIKDHVVVKDTIISRININKAEFVDLVRHPYIDRNLANNLIQLRAQHGEFQHINEIRKSHLVDNNTFALIAPYITVEK